MAQLKSLDQIAPVPVKQKNNWSLNHHDRKKRQRQCEGPQVEKESPNFGYQNRVLSSRVILACM